MERYTLDDHLEVVREALVETEDWDILPEATLRTAMKIVRAKLQILDARLDGGSAERRRKDRQRSRRDGRLTGYETSIEGL